MVYSLVKYTTDSKDIRTYLLTSAGYADTQ